MKSRIYVKLPGKKTVHLIESEAEGVPYSHTALCGVSATVTRRVPRFDYVKEGNRTHQICTGMGSIVFKDVEGWEVSFRTQAGKTEICKRCQRCVDRETSQRARHFAKLAVKNTKRRKAERAAKK